MQVFAALIDRGVSFVHSDADAFWLRDPSPHFSEVSQADLVFSSGTSHPREAFSAWGFTLCAGFFFAQANPKTQYFFHQALAISERIGNDQLGLNQAVIEDGLVWDTTKVSARKVSGPSGVVTFDQALLGRGQSGLEVVLLPHALFARIEGLANENTVVLHPKNSPLAKLSDFQQSHGIRSPFAT